MRTTRLYLFTTTLISLLVLGTAVPRSTLAQTPKPAKVKSVAPATKPPRSPSLEGEHKDNLKPFRGIATKLSTTPDALEDAYETANQANPKLTRGQFIAANVLAQNLGSKNPAITTTAILDGLRSHKSIGQTLQSLGLSKSDAKEAEKAADREVKEADKAAKAQTKTQDQDAKPNNP